MCDCAAEEARRLAAETKGKGGMAAGAGRNSTARAVPARRRSASTSEGSSVPWGPVIGGTALMALFVFLAKTGTDPDGWASPIHAFIHRLRESSPAAYGEEECEVKIDNLTYMRPLHV